MLATTALIFLGALAAQERAPQVFIRLDPAAGEVLLRGTPVKLYLRTDRDAYVTVFRADTEGRLSIVYPDRPWANNYLRSGRTYEFPPTGAAHAFTAESEPGVGYLFAVAADEPFDYHRAVRGERWDHGSLLSEGRVRGDPFGSFTRLAEQILRDPRTVYGSALVTYRVEGLYHYPRFVCYGCHAPASHSVWDPYERTCPRFALVRYTDPKAGYRYGFRDLQDPLDSARDWISGVLDLRGLIPWVSKPGPALRPPEGAGESAPGRWSLLRNLTPRLERRLPPALPERPDSPPPPSERRRRPTR